MTNQVIPDAAVEAAKSAVRAHAHVDLEAEHLIEGIVRTILEAAAPHLMALALEGAADEADGVIAAGDIAEVAAPVEGEYGRSEAVAARDSLYEDGPGDFLRARAEEFRKQG